MRSRSQGDLSGITLGSCLDFAIQVACDPAAAAVNSELVRERICFHIFSKVVPLPNLP